MSVAIAKQFITKMETHIAIGNSRIDAAENRGHLTDEDLAFLDSIDFSQIPICMKSFELAARAEGKAVRNRDHCIPDPLTYKGLHVCNKGARGALYIYGDIGFGGISATEFRSQLETFSPQEPIELHVHSPGGSFVEAVAIHSLISNRRGEVHGFVNGRASSAGSLVLMPCRSVTMAPQSQLMIHFASIEAQGSYGEEDLARALKVTRDTNQHLVKLYLPRWRGTEDELRQALERETYFTPSEAVACGLADFISPNVKVAAYEVVTRSHRSLGFELAASEGPRTWFIRRRARLRLWQMECDQMRREISE